MKIELRDGLWLANILNGLLILFVVFVPQSPVRMVLGIPFVFFFPGYALVTALVPRKADMSGVERVALSFGLSIALVILIGLFLNFTPFGIRLAPMVFSVAAVVLALSVIAWLRLKRIAAEERFSLSLFLPSRLEWPRSTGARVVSGVLAVVVLASIGTVAYVTARPKAGEAFTEFYILGPEGQAANYPRQVRVDETAHVIVGIVSHENEPVTYRVEVLVNGTRNTEAGPIDLQPGGKWEGEVSFAPHAAGADQKVEFVLHASPALESAQQSLRLWIDVVP